MGVSGKERETRARPLVFARDCVYTRVSVAEAALPSEGPSFPLGEMLADLFLSAVRVIIKMVMKRFHKSLLAQSSSAQQDGVIITEWT